MANTSFTDFPDYLGSGAVGTALFINEEAFNIPVSGVQTFGPYFMGTAAAIGLALGTNTAGAMEWEATWYPDAEMTIPLANGVYNKAVNSSTTYDFVAAMGPYLLLSAVNQGTGIASVSQTLAWALPVSPLAGGLGGANNADVGRTLAFASVRTLVSGGSAVISAQAFTPGPATLSLQSSAAGGVAEIVLTAGGFANNAIVAISNDGGGPTRLCQTVTLPNDDWYLQINNISAASINIAASVVTQR